MDSTARAAFVIAQAACAHARLAAMSEENAADRAAGRDVRYNSRDFEAVSDEFLIGHNAVISYLREG